MRTLLAITASAVATAAILVLCDACPTLPPSVNFAFGQPLGGTSAEHRDDSDADSALACNCSMSGPDRFDAGCFLWCPLDFDDDAFSDDE